MDIAGLKGSHQLLAQQIQNQQSVNTQAVEGVENRGGFGELFMNQLQSTNQLQAVADTELQNFVLGESDNLHNVMIAMEEASLSLQFTAQVRNRVVDAYNEIRNMQI